MDMLERSAHASLEKLEFGKSAYSNNLFWSSSTFTLHKQIKETKAPLPPLSFSTVSLSFSIFCFWWWLILLLISFSLFLSGTVVNHWPHWYGSEMSNFLFRFSCSQVNSFYFCPKVGLGPCHLPLPLPLPSPWPIFATRLLFFFFFFLSPNRESILSRWMFVVPVVLLLAGRSLRPVSLEANEWLHYLHYPRGRWAFSHGTSTRR